MTKEMGLKNWEQERKKKTEHDDRLKAVAYGETNWFVLNEIKRLEQYMDALHKVVINKVDSTQSFFEHVHVQSVQDHNKLVWEIDEIKRKRDYDKLGENEYAPPPFERLKELEQRDKVMGDCLCAANERIDELFKLVGELHKEKAKEGENVGDAYTKEHGYIETPFRRHWTEEQIKQAAKRDKAARQNNPLMKET